MSEPLDLRRSAMIVRRRGVLIGVAALLGILIACGFSVLNPPKVTSKVLVAYPRAAQSMSTQVVLAESNPVLSGALPSISPPTTLQALRGEIQASSLSIFILQISATGSTAAQAEQVANAVANSFVSYVGSATSPVGRIPVKIFQSATSATGTGPVTQLLIAGVIGGIAGALVGVVAALAIGRKDRRLRGRDEIANSIGVPVLAAVPVKHPDGAPEWIKALQGYQPTAVQAWQLRSALRRLGVLGVSTGNGSGPSSSLAVLSIATDPGALALGPQLAAFAASLGIPTALVVGPQQDENVTAALRTACTLPPSQSEGLPAKLRVCVSEGGHVDLPPGVALMVLVIVVAGHAPKLPVTVRTDSIVIGVSAGAATAEELARAAVSAAVDGREVAGILVADPDPTDKTTGRIPTLVRPAQRRLPTHLNGLVAEIKR